MTLQQAHELQRRELISLRAKVARLEKESAGLFTVAEKEALERRIRHLEQVNKTENRRHEEARAHWKHMESIKHDLELENLELKDDIVNIGLHFFHKDVRPMQLPVKKYSTVVA